MQSVDLVDICLENSPATQLFWPFCRSPTDQPFGSGPGPVFIGLINANKMLLGSCPPPVCGVSNSRLHFSLFSIVRFADTRRFTVRQITNVALTVAIMAFAVSTVRADLIGHWTFDEASSGTGTGTALDSSGNSYNGTISGAAVYTTGRIGFGALTFDGSNDYVDVGYHAALALAGSNYTLSWWMNWGGNTGVATQRIINFDNGADLKGGYAALYSSQNGGFAFSQSDGSDRNWWTNIMPTQDGWHNMTITFDGINRNFYVGGDLKGTLATTTSVIDRMYANPSNPDDLRFGSIPVYGQYYKGSLDDIRIYNNALSAAEVKSLAGIPEPSCLILLGIGLVSLLAYTWRKQK